MSRFRKKRLQNAIGYALFFLTVAVCVTATVAVCASVYERTGENKGVAIAVMLLVIAFLSLLCTIFDVVRRKWTVEPPVESILAWTERMAHGDFSARLTPRHAYRKYDEFDVIMENLNLLAEELGKTEIVQSDFISSVSHELKTPVAVVKSYASLLKKQTLSDEEREKCVSTILSATSRMSDLVTNILKLNKLENQSVKPTMKKFDLTEQLTEAILAFEETVEKKRLILSCDLKDVEIVSSPELLSIVWNNLLSNAVKFTPEGGVVSVSLKRERGKVVVSVSDTGEGIPPQVGRRIFEKFYQADSSRSGEGNGLGLALVKKVIDILGGEIAVESEEGKGSTFTVTIAEEI